MSNKTYLYISIYMNEYKYEHLHTPLFYKYMHRYSLCSGTYCVHTLHAYMHVPMLCTCEEVICTYCILYYVCHIQYTNLHYNYSYLILIWGVSCQLFNTTLTLCCWIRPRWCKLTWIHICRRWKCSTWVKNMCAWLCFINVLHERTERRREEKDWMEITERIGVPGEFWPQTQKLSHRHDRCLPLAYS